MSLGYDSNFAVKHVKAYFLCTENRCLGIVGQFQGKDSRAQRSFLWLKLTLQVGTPDSSLCLGGFLGGEFYGAQECFRC